MRTRQGSVSEDLKSEQRGGGGGEESAIGF